MAEEETGSETNAPSTDPWVGFERRLAAYLSTMFDPSDADNLKLYVPRPADEEPWVIDLQTVSDGQVIRIGYGWDEVYTTPDSPADALHQLRTVLEGGKFRTAHPQLLTVSAEGPASTGVGVLGLAVRGTVSDVDGEAESVLITRTRDQLLGALRNHLRSDYDVEAELDEDGDIPLTVDGMHLWIGVRSPKPTIMLFTRTVDNVHSRRQACVDLNVLNRSNLWSRWVCRDHSVWQHLTIPSPIFQPQLFDEMLHLFVTDYLATRLDLADRLGGQPASG